MFVTYKNNGYVKIDVKDNGIGISEEDIKAMSLTGFTGRIDQEKESGEWAWTFY